MKDRYTNPDQFSFRFEKDSDELLEKFKDSTVAFTGDEEQSFGDPENEKPELSFEEIESGVRLMQVNGAWKKYDSSCQDSSPYKTSGT